MPDDPEAILPPIGENDPAPRGRPRLICEHCGCQLTPAGDVLRMSDTARGHNRHAETLAKRDAAIAELETKNRELAAKVAELSAPKPSKDRDFFLG